MFARPLTAAALAIGLAAPLAAQEASLDTVLANVGDTPITLGDMLIARSQLPPQFQQIPAEALYDGLLTQLIQQQMFSDSLETVSPRTEMAIAYETRAIRAAEVIEAAAIDAITDEAVQAAYDARIADFDGGTEYHAAHILVETEEEAQQIIEALLAGDEFAQTAQEKSTGPSGPSGGDLGWFGPGMMVPEFEEAVMALAPGDLSDPVQTQFGWHVIKLLETRAKAAPAIEELRPEIEQQILGEVIEARVAELEAATEVSRTEGIDPTVIDQMELLSAQ